MGRNFTSEFRPQLTPKEMLRLGVFGGKYMTDCGGEFPASWFARARLCADRHDPGLNYFGVNALQSLAQWRRHGWIHPQDPRGWFQWYCRYYMGRRTRDDAGRSDGGAPSRGMSPRFARTASQVTSTVDGSSGQAVLHWAYDSRVI